MCVILPPFGYKLRIYPLHGDQARSCEHAAALKRLASTSPHTPQENKFSTPHQWKQNVRLPPSLAPSRRAAASQKSRVPAPSRRRRGLAKNRPRSVAWQNSRLPLLLAPKIRHSVPPKTNRKFHHRTLAPCQIERTDQNFEIPRPPRRPLRSMALYIPPCIKGNPSSVHQSFVQPPIHGRNRTRPES